MSDRARILFVDDDPELLESLADLWGLDHDVETASGGEAALALMARWMPEVVISDMRMPGMDGAAFLAEVRTRAPDAMRILLTGQTDIEAAIRAVNEGGIFRFLSKPCGQKAMEGVINDALARYRGRQAVQAAQQAEVRALISQLAQADRLATLGTMSATLSHEMNNSLTLLASAITAIQEDSQEARPADAETVRLLVTGRERLVAQASGALSMARTSDRGTGALCLAEVIDELADMLRRSGLLRRTRLVVTACEGPSPRIVFDRTELEQILINLVKNASDAVPAGRVGTIELTISPRGARTSIVVRDDGSGIDAPILARIFEPFFTTKPAGEGTGLGLPLVRRLVEAAGGTIQVDSVVGHGTTFTLDLPCAPAASVPHERMAGREMKRIDVLPARRPVLSGIQGRVIASEFDPILQDLVERACAATVMPIAMVSLVLERMQVFRAHVGLPADLAAVCGTDRDASFCQFVVRDEVMFEVTDAHSDDRVPTELVERYGVAAYLGAPIHLGGAVVGSLCVLDVVPRTFTPADREALTGLAARVTARLGALARDDGALESTLHERAVRPVFAELRNLLQPVLINFSAMRIAAAELGCVQRLLTCSLEQGSLPPVAATLTRTTAALADLHATIEDGEQSIGDIRRAVAALERVSLHVARTAVAEIIDAATTLSHHHSKLVRGVTWSGAGSLAFVDVPRPVAVSTLAAALTAIAGELVASRSSGGIQGRVERRAAEVVIGLTAPALTAAWLTGLAASLRTLAGDGRGIGLRVGPELLEVVLTSSADASREIC